MKHHFTPFPVLHTQRLLLRPLTLLDEMEIFELRSNDVVNRFLDRPKAQSLEDARRFIQKIIENVQLNEGIYWALAFQNDPRLIGGITLWNFDLKNDTAEMGYELLPQYQGQGLMQEALAKVIEYAFTTMQLRSIVAASHIHNNGSLNLLKKNHFTLHPSQEEPNMAIYVLTKT